MGDPIDFIFFCSAADYPKFLALLPDHLPTSYSEFIARVDKHIEKSKEQVTIHKTNVGFDEFIAFCTKSGHVQNYESLVLCAFLTRGANRNRGK